LPDVAQPEQIVGRHVPGRTRLGDGLWEQIAAIGDSSDRKGHNTD